MQPIQIARMLRLSAPKKSGGGGGVRGMKRKRFWAKGKEQYIGRKGGQDIQAAPSSSSTTTTTVSQGEDGSVQHYYRKKKTPPHVALFKFPSSSDGKIPYPHLSTTAFSDGKN